MCGICGIWSEPSVTAIQAMLKAMRHRGPDDSGHFIDDNLAIGMTRLAIMDLSPAGHQPMSVAGGDIQIVYNGEVYNFAQERVALESRGVIFKSRSDTEVVLRLYEAYGDDFLLRLRGMFALAVYDRRRGRGAERLLLARDHLGIKPLLVARSGKQILFASELKCLLASGMVPREIDPEGLRLLLTFGAVYQPKTILKNVEMLLPGHRMILEPGRPPRTERYWSMGIDRVAGVRARSYQEQVELVADKLEESVRLQMVSDVPVGAFLSGGVDSSFLVGMMTRLVGSRVKTFSVGFADEGASLDETREAENTARFFGADHTRVLIGAREFGEHVANIASDLDQPTVDGVNTYFVSQAARRHVTVALSGTGGDELFAGYPWFAQMAAFERDVERRPWHMAAMNLLARVARSSTFDPLMFGRWGNQLTRARTQCDFLGRYSNTYQIFGVMGAASLIPKEIHREAGVGRAMAADLAAIDELAAGAAVERVSALCLRGYTSNQLLRDVDAASMAHSLEVRVPFLDVPLLELALSLPPSAKMGEKDPGVPAHLATYRELGAKRVLIDAGRYRRVLPDSIDQQPKRGFSLPIDAWLKTNLRDLVEDTLGDRAVAQRGLLDPAAVGAVRQDFLSGSSHWSAPWLLMMLELWCRNVFDRS